MANSSPVSHPTGNVAIPTIPTEYAPDGSGIWLHMVAHARTREHT